ncbi:MAG: filamentous hemagglutinin N-terminal domain-containing protein, partial [Proteobacteria bacterium]|nr:filamentous hemagglutinin N-terminal domain-containing protein [Pseudomonadota bacterium]
MGKREFQLLKPRPRPLALLVCALLAGRAVAQLPSGGQVVAGAATIASAGPGQQVITQGSDRAIIHWQDFSIGAGNAVRFVQPGATSVILNRVTGSDPSRILGNLTANGQVFLVNPQGIYFGAGARLDVGGLVASTLSLRDDDFMTGRYRFSRVETGTGRAEVVNDGALRARDQGYVVLAGDYAANRGVIEARLGSVLLAAGQQMTLDVAGDRLIGYAVNERTVAELAGVANSGQLMADGGRVVMTAATARSLASSAVNNSGAIQARGVAEQGGTVYLLADGGDIRIDAASRIDVSGAGGGGDVRIGGDFHGGALPRAATVSVAAGAVIDADGGAIGDGGRVAVWSEGETRFAGVISARGGTAGGDGGFVEVSGKHLRYTGTVDTRATQGHTGTLLLDPANITISSAADSDITAATPFTDATDDGGTSNLSVATLQTALAASNVTVNTATSSGADAGNITVQNAVTWATGSQLSLIANGAIALNAAITAHTGTFSLSAGSGATQSAAFSVGSLELLGSGVFALGNGGNSVGTLAANVSGSVTLTTSGALILGTAGSSAGVNTQGGAFKLNTGGALSQTGPLQTGSLELNSSAGAVTLSNANNLIGAIAASTQGDLTLANSAANLYIQTVGGTTGINTNGHNFTLANGAGTLWMGNGNSNGTLSANQVYLTSNRILQYWNAPINAGQLLVQTTNYAGLSGTANSVNTLAVLATGPGGGASGQSFDFLNNKSLTIDTVNGVSGITTANTDAKVEARGNLTVANNINLGTGALALFANDGNSYYNVDASTVSLTAGALAFKAGGLKIPLVYGVKTLSGYITQSFGYTAPNELTIGSVWGVAGLTAFGNIYLTTGQFSAGAGLPAYDPVRPYSDYVYATNKYRAGLMLDEGINANGGLVYLNSASGVYQYPDPTNTANPGHTKILAGGLLLSGEGQFDLAVGQNQVGTVAANVNGSFNYVNSGPLSVGQLVFFWGGNAIANISGVTTRADTLISGSVAGGDAQYNQHNILLSASDDPNSGSNQSLTLNRDVSADLKGSSSVYLATSASDNHKDALVSTSGTARVLGSTLVMGSSQGKGTFKLKTYVSALTAAGGMSMLVDNTDWTQRLTVLGIGTAQGGGSPTPVGNFYLSTGGSMLLLGGKSNGDYLELRADQVDMFGPMEMKDGARVLLQPLTLSNRIGIHDAADFDGFVPQTDYARNLFQQFNQTATFYVGSTPAVMNNDANVPAEVKSQYVTGDIHIAGNGDGGMRMGYRSLSAETTGRIVAHPIGDVFNLRLVAPFVTAYGFNVTGNRLQIFSDTLSLPSAAGSYSVVTQKGPQSDTAINLRSYSNPAAIWVGALGNRGFPVNVSFPAALLQKFPDYSNIIVSGSTDSPLIFANSADILLAFGGQFDLGHRTLTLSSPVWVYGGDGSHVFDRNSYTLAAWNSGNLPKVAAVHSANGNNDNGTTGGLWGGCASLSVCQGTNSSTPTGPGTPIMDPVPPPTGTSTSCTGGGCTTPPPPPPPPPAGPPGSGTPTTTINNVINVGSNNPTSGGPGANTPPPPPSGGLPNPNDGMGDGGPSGPGFTGGPGGPGSTNGDPWGTGPLAGTPGNSGTGSGGPGGGGPGSSSSNSGGNGGDLSGLGNGGSGGGNASLGGAGDGLGGSGSGTGSGGGNGGSGGNGGNGGSGGQSGQGSGAGTGGDGAGGSGSGMGGGLGDGGSGDGGAGSGVGVGSGGAGGGAGGSGGGSGNGMGDGSGAGSGRGSSAQGAGGDGTGGSGGGAGSGLGDGSGSDGGSGSGRGGNGLDESGQGGGSGRGVGDGGGGEASAGSGRGQGNGGDEGDGMGAGSGRGRGGNGLDDGGQGGGSGRG